MSARRFRRTSWRAVMTWYAFRWSAAATRSISGLRPESCSMNSSTSAANSNIDRDDMDADDNVHGIHPLALLCTLRWLDEFDVALDAAAHVVSTLAHRMRVDET